MGRLQVAIAALTAAHRRAAAYAPWHEAWGEVVVQRLQRWLGRGMPDHLHLAGRFHFPRSSVAARRAASTVHRREPHRAVAGVTAGALRNSAGAAVGERWPLTIGEQRLLLERSGYAAAEARRIARLLDARRCLRGDPERRLLESCAAQALFDGVPGMPRDLEWRGWIWQLWDSVPPAQAIIAQGTFPMLRSLPLPEPPPPTGFTSALLGTAVDARIIRAGEQGPSWPKGPTDRVGFPEVLFALVGHGLDVQLRPKRVDAAAFDAVLPRWLALDASARAKAMRRIRKHYKRVRELSPAPPTPARPRRLEWEDLEWEEAVVERPRGRPRGLALRIRGRLRQEPSLGCWLTVDDKERMFCASEY